MIHTLIWATIVAGLAYGVWFMSRKDKRRD